MVYFLDEVIELTRKQYELLVYLIKHKNKIISREQLLNAVWDFDFVGDTRMVDIHISHLRDKLEKDSKNPEYIKNVRGSFYKINKSKLNIFYLKRFYLMLYDIFTFFVIQVCFIFILAI